MLGIVFYLLVLIFNKPVYNLFISGLNVQTYNLFNKYFNILSLSIIFIIPNNVIQAYLNANSKIGLAYLSQSIPNIFILIGFISFLYFESNIINLAYLFLIGNTIVFIFLFMFKKNINKFSLDRNILETIKSSLKIRTAHNIHNFLSLIIINNFVSGLPLPESSTFLYTKKVSDTIFGVIYNPSNRLLVNLISSYKLENNLFKIKPVLIKNTIIMSIVFLFIGAGGFILIPGLNYIYPLNTSIIEWIGITFSCLMIVNLLMAVEIPYAIINLAFNASRIFFISNSIYILFLYIFVRYCNFYFGHYTLAFGLATVQIVNFILIRQFAILSYIK